MREAYSVGGGFVEWQGEEAPVRPQPPYPFSSMADLRRLVEETGLPLPDVLMANEATGLLAVQLNVTP